MLPSILTPVSDPGLVRGDHLGPAQGRDGALAPGLEPALGPAQQVRQPALADGQAEQVGQRRLEAFVGQRLVGLEVSRHRVQARPERGARHGGWHCGHDPRAAARTPQGHAAVALDLRLYRGQLDALVHAGLFARRIRRQGDAAAWAVVGNVADRLGNLGAQGPAVALVARLGATRLAALALRLAICRGRLGGGARGLLRPLQPQHQLDQPGLAQALKLVPPHAWTGSAMPPRCKGVGNYSPLFPVIRQPRCTNAVSHALALLVFKP